MGVVYAKLRRRLVGKPEARILMVGLDAAGKTTILHQLKHGEVVPTSPTVGFNVESFEYKRLRFTVFDVEGQDKVRSLWPYYCEGSHGFIFVVDSNDRDRIGDARKGLATLSKEMKNAVLLVFANKQDLPGAMTAEEVSQHLTLSKLQSGPWFVQSSCATSRDGLYEGLDWLASAVSTKK
mmetsp:Transcript_255/g.887  ORF Transcript_255/g.887 Transcript_255/m.887 type:complete len:180 (-) Transcript_255:158-697(-)|eukprot:CAMPEP_0194532714 /NCGR_PEP_ID=MMETSP0253-20130528/70352_1 /TAXON_ID=2966 /ORGANISM="Noctiluca scintillans" /LENGTH=179 /DNA_ID=CAMNT_0039378195 /DNA_START=74 /DNA_END=613 /DNA_ORIENTATION=+